MCGQTIRDFLPDSDISETHQIEIHAPADLVFDIACAMDLESIPPVRAIFWLRAKLFGSRPAPAGRPKGLVDLTTSLGWRPLAGQPHRELVMGAAAQPWLADVVFRPLEPDQFKAFAEPDFVKIAWTLEAQPVDAGRTRFRTHTRALATNEDARRKFRRYWRKIRIGVVLIRRLLLRALRRQAELRYRSLPRQR